MNFGMITLQNIRTAKLCYMDTDSFAIHIKTKDFYKDIANDVEKWFDTSNFDESDKRSFQQVRTKKLIVLFKDELGGRIMKEFVVLRAKTYSYLWMMTVNIKKLKEQKSV